MAYEGTRKLLAYAEAHGQTYTDEDGRVWTPAEAVAQTGLDYTSHLNERWWESVGEDGAPLDEEALALTESLRLMAEATIQR